MIIKHSYIKQIGPKKFRVYSEKGKNMGTYSSKSGAKKRLREIEYFKHQNSADDNGAFSRSGEGKVPEFFRRNLDYGERGEALAKRLKKLKTVKSSLSVLGFKKEAAKVGKSIKDTLIMAFLSLTFAGAGLHSLNNSIESGYLRDVASDFATEDSPSSEVLKKSFPKGTSLDNIVSDLYKDIDLSGKEDIAKELIVEYNSNLDFSGDEKLKFKDSGFLKHSAEVAYPDLKKIMDKFSERLESGYDITEVGIVGEMSISEEEKEAIMSVEGFSEKIYNDDKRLKWPKDKERGAGHWTIGYGHKLTKNELDSGVIVLKDGSRVPWRAGISKSDGIRIKGSDLIANSLVAAGVSEDTEISRPMFDALTDLSFNVGTGGLSRFISSIKDDSGNLSPDLFAKKISGWTKVENKEQRKGIIIRRISELLTAKGVLLPENPRHVLEDSISTKSRMSLPKKSVVFDYLSSFDDNNTLTEKEVESVLNALAENPPNSPSDFVKIISSVI